MQQRYYDPVVGRFYSNDPVGFTASNPMMFNRYAYANNNPYKYTDPNGENPAVAVSRSFQAGYSVGSKINSGITIALGKPLGVAIYNAVNNESATDKAIEGIKEGKESAKGEAGEKGQLEGTGGQEGAQSDLGDLPLEPGSEWSSSDGSRQGGTLEDGRKVNIHPSGGGGSYPKGTPTLEVQKPNGKTELKIRYPEEKT